MQVPSVYENNNNIACNFLVTFFIAGNISTVCTFLKNLIFFWPGIFWGHPSEKCLFVIPRSISANFKNSNKIIWKLCTFIVWVGVNCSKFDCSTINWLTLLAGNQLLDTKFINCSNPVNPGSTGFEQLTKKMTTGQHCRAVDTSL